MKTGALLLVAAFIAGSIVVRAGYAFGVLLILGALCLFACAALSSRRPVRP